MLDKLAATMSVKMKNYFTTRTDSVEIYEYMLKVLLNTFGVILICTVISYTFGYLEIELLTLLLVGVLKFFTGGIHIKNNDICVLVSSFLLLSLPILYLILQPFILNYSYIISTLSFIIIAFLSPKGISVSKKQKVIYKLVSIFIFMICVFLIKNNSVIFSQSLHCISLLLIKENGNDQ